MARALKGLGQQAQLALAADKHVTVAIGQGRVWTGKQALEVGLVDELGGFYTAVRRAKADGAKAVIGGEPNTELGGLYYQPTLFVDAGAATPASSYQRNCWSIPSPTPRVAMPT